MSAGKGRERRHTDGQRKRRESEYCEVRKEVPKFSLLIVSPVKVISLYLLKPLIVPLIHTPIEEFSVLLLDL